MLPEEDVTRLRHMLEAAQAALRFVAGRTRADLDTDEVLYFALVRAIQIVGEAAANVGPEGRSACPEIPWPAVVGMRHRVVHAYWDIDRSRIWETATDDLPPLIAVLERALAQEGTP